VRNWPDDPPAVEPKRIELSAVHVVVQLRINDADTSAELIAPLRKKIAAWEAAGGVRILSVQPLRRYVKPVPYAQKPQPREHFGFADGDGQPVIDPQKAGKVYRNQVQLGELLLGYPNEADQAPGHAAVRAGLSWLRNGTFLVIRKLKQDVAALEEAVRKASADTGLTRAASREDDGARAGWRARGELCRAQRGQAGQRLRL
jgi:deferrochelatase/peroxidase EfeB